MIDVTEPTMEKGSEPTASHIRQTARKNTRKKPEKAHAKGLAFGRMLSKKGINPFDAITWEKREAGISDDSGKAIFSQKDVEVPEFWSMLATNVVSSKSPKPQNPV